MKLHEPFIIPPRLLPGVRVGKNSFISIEFNGLTNSGRTRYKYHIDCNSNSDDKKIIHFTRNDLKSGCQGGSLVDGMESLLSFLGAAVDSYRHNRYQYSDDPDDNCSLFPKHIVEWAYQNVEEISYLLFEIEDKKEKKMDLIAE